MTNEPRHVQWIVDGVSGDAPDHWRSALASNRYRAILPAQELLRLGHRVELVDPSRWHVGRGDRLSRPDAVVVGKLLPGKEPARFQQLSARVLDQVRAATAQGLVVLGDFNDDHFDHPVLGPHWTGLARSVDTCTVGSEAMAARVRTFTDRPVVVVGDPVASPPGAARVFSGVSGIARLARSLMPGGGGRPRLKFAWYGNAVNWPAMQDWAERLATLGEEQPIVIWAVTTPQPRIEQFAHEFNRRHGPNAILECIPWDEATQWSVVADADIVLIPSDPGDAKKLVKTGNRLTDALNAGRFVIGSPLPAYAPYASHVSLTDDPVAAVRAYLADPRRALSMIEAGQAAARSMAGQRAIADAWLAAIRASVPQAAASAVAPSETKEPTPAPAGAAPGTSPMTAMTSLEQIHRSKKSKVSDKWQSYFAFYERNFTDFRRKPVSLLEIGVQNGGSLEVWAQYFPEARALVGCDIDNKCALLKYDDPRISVVVGDANQNEVASRIQAICPAFDIVIDDGSHLSDDIINSFLRYFSALKPGGVYIVEDSHTMYRESHQGGILRRTTAHEFFKLMVDLVNHEHWEKELSIKTLFGTFAPPGPLLPVLQDGWVDGIEFRNSLICIRKALTASHRKLGERVVSGSEAIVRIQPQASVPPGSATAHDFAGDEQEDSRPTRAERLDASTASAALVRLNLGCGDKILDGYVNVDVVEARAGRSPDVICDLHDLSTFDSDHADEVMAIHVVEHFWRWEIEDVLKEWIRVLKPGGKLILECPNLQSACEAFLADPDKRSRPDQSGQTTMWVLYGDPSWKDPLMVHRWGYTPRSLAKLLQAVGLVDIRQEPAQYKLREPRDMRIVGIKPV